MCSARVFSNAERENFVRVPKRRLRQSGAQAFQISVHFPNLQAADAWSDFIPNMTSIHNHTITVRLREGSVEIRELSWPDALHLYNALMAQTKAFMDDKGQLVLDAAKFVAAIQENVELGKWLVLASTRKDEDWLQHRTLSEVLDLVTEAAVLNIGIIVERIKNGRSRLSRCIGMAGEDTTPNLQPSGSTGKSPT